MKRAFFYIFLAAVVIGLTPWIIAFAALGLASVFGCTEGGPSSACFVMGADIGPTLNTMILSFFLGWFALPITAFSALGLLILGLITRKGT